MAPRVHDVIDVPRVEALRILALLTKKIVNDCALVYPRKYRSSNTTCSDARFDMNKSDIDIDLCAHDPSVTIIEGRFRAVLEDGLGADEEGSGNITVTVNPTCRLGPGPALVRLLSLIDLISEALAAGRVLTMRQLWYLTKGTLYNFRNEVVCYNAVRFIGTITCLTRSSLGVYAQSKGAFAAPPGFHVKTRSLMSLASGNSRSGSRSGSRSTCRDKRNYYNNDESDANEMVVVMDDASSGASVKIRPEVTRAGSTTICIAPGFAPPQAVLVVEKETVFASLVQAGIPAKLNIVVIVGKGFPCLATRAFLALLADTLPAARVLGLFDYNPFGLAIALMYTHGPSRALEAEAYRYAVPRLEHIGLRARDINELASYMTAASQVLQQSDLSMIASLKRTFPDGSPAIGDGLAWELDFMTAGACKFELEALGRMNALAADFLITVWLPQTVHAAVKGTERVSLI